MTRVRLRHNEKIQLPLFENGTTSMLSETKPENDFKLVPLITTMLSITLNHRSVCMSSSNTAQQKQRPASLSCKTVWWYNNGVEHKTDWRLITRFEFLKSIIRWSRQTGLVLVWTTPSSRGLFVTYTFVHWLIHL